MRRDDALISTCRSPAVPRCGGQARPGGRRQWRGRRRRPRAACPRWPSLPGPARARRRRGYQRLLPIRPSRPMPLSITQSRRARKFPPRRQHRIDRGQAARWRRRCIQQHPHLAAATNQPKVGIARGDVDLVGHEQVVRFDDASGAAGRHGHLPREIGHEQRRQMLREQDRQARAPRQPATNSLIAWMPPVEAPMAMQAGCQSATSRSRGFSPGRTDLRSMAPTRPMRRSRSARSSANRPPNMPETAWAWCRPHPAKARAPPLPLPDRRPRRRSAPWRRDPPR
jgi:hypothetical protein